MITTNKAPLTISIKQILIAALFFHRPRAPLLHFLVVHKFVSILQSLHHDFRLLPVFVVVPDVHDHRHFLHQLILTFKTDIRVHRHRLLPQLPPASHLRVRLLLVGFQFPVDLRVLNPGAHRLPGVPLSHVEQHLELLEPHLGFRLHDHYLVPVHLSQPVVHFDQKLTRFVFVVYVVLPVPHRHLDGLLHHVLVEEELALDLDVIHISRDAGDEFGAEHALPAGFLILRDQTGVALAGA